MLLVGEILMVTNKHDVYGRTHLPCNGPSPTYISRH